MMTPNLLGALAVLALFDSKARALDNGLGKTPPMGWNTWYNFRCDLNETVIHEAVEAFLDYGLLDVGYEYINLDDCWQLRRDMNTGQIVEDRDKFPSGMTALGDYIHSKGLKFGLYSDAGLMTCQQRPGSLGVESIDAQTYADFGCDFLKYDNCFSFHLPPQQRYQAMRDALNATGRPIFYSLCEWGEQDPATWAPPVGNSWRTTPDIGQRPTWSILMKMTDLNEPLWSTAGPGGWNDPDMLQVGKGHLTLAEQKSQFTLWAIMKAPLLLGNDIRHMSGEILEIIRNKKLIAINQDALGIQAHVVWSSEDKDTVKGQQVWAGPLHGGDFVIVMLNRGALNNVEITVNWNDIPDFYTETTTVVLEDLWNSKNVTAKGSFTTHVQAHDVAAFRASPVTTAS
ncbi:Probable alpha-galactosidase B [Seminavis robusta]|uniref:Alpha-galactosidase n=1 Tax=Seminavis robusta TaxID=568900 RepID=A0A9N8DKF0_9STRA|nr:Probable alpha-galactosidase B [Seminavis robusta]|eukprot:Sro134_g063340.1 Probable alpha-galactosidase B (399) ;mRNA; f:15604-16927